MTPDSPDEGPIWRRIAAELAGEITSGVLVPGASLPTAIQLSERFGVHRHTVRQAFRHLAEAGLVTVQQGRGTFVTGHRLPYPIGRTVSFRANLAAVGRQAAGRTVSCRSVPATSEVARALGLEPGSAVWAIRGLSEADGVPISTSLHHLDMTRFPDFPDRLTAAGGSFSAAFAACGHAAYQRLSTRLIARAATAQEAELLRLPEGAAVMQSLAVDGLPDGTALQCLDSAFAGDRVEFVVSAE